MFLFYLDSLFILDNSILRNVKKREMDGFYKGVLMETTIHHIFIMMVSLPMIRLWEEESCSFINLK